MKKAFLFMAAVGMLLSVFASGMAYADATEVVVGKGTLKVGGILQAGMTYNTEDEGNTDMFTLNRARFLFSGTIIPDKVSYFVQTETKGGTGLLDYKARFFYIPETEITVGRFLPNFTIYMPASTGKLEMINYPWTTSLKVEGEEMSFAMWRQTGVQTTTKTEFVDFNVGIFNGADKLDNVDDNNDAKDFLVRAEVKPPIENAKVRVGGFGWFGSADAIASLGSGYDPTTYSWQTDLEEDDTLSDTRFGGFAKADYKMDDMTLKFRGEFVTGTCEYIAGPVVGKLDDIKVEETTSQGYFAHVGVQPDPRYEVLLRFEGYDGNTDVDNNGLTRLTVGGNYYLDGMNAMIYLNYLHTMYEADGVDAVGKVQAQVQIMF